MVLSKRQRLLKHLSSAAISAVIAFFIFVFGVNIGRHGLDLSISKTDTSGDLPDDLNYSSVEQIYDLLRRDYDGQLDLDEVMTSIKRGLVESTGDPYSEFFDAEAASGFNDSLEGKFTGIGAELGKKDGQLIIVAPLRGFPAEAAGLKSGDAIVGIDGQETYNISIYEAVLQIRGDADTDVVLDIVRDGDLQEFTVTRALITVPSVTSEVIDGRVGLIEISRFADDTTDLARQAAQAMIDQGINKFVIDLRGNPGGYLDQAVALSSLWLDRGQLVVEVRAGSKTVDSLKASGGSIFSGSDTVILVDEGSASASEIVAGALKDNQAAVVMGQQTYGKGSVQSVIKLGNDELLKVTTARWYTPGGRNIDEQGVEPDIVVPRQEDVDNTDSDNQLDQAVEYLDRD